MITVVQSVLRRDRYPLRDQQPGADGAAGARARPAHWRDLLLRGHKGHIIKILAHDYQGFACSPSGSPMVVLPGRPSRIRSPCRSPRRSFRYFWTGSTGAGRPRLIGRVWLANFARFGGDLRATAKIATKCSIRSPRRLAGNGDHSTQVQLPDLRQDHPGARIS